MHRALPALIGLLLLAHGAAALPAQTLRGSRVAMERQNDVARNHDYTFLRSGAQVRRFAGLGLLVPIQGNGNLELKGVSFPYARPALKTFVTRLAGQYRSACGEKLVVTSLTRPLTEQPRNASDLSVHPAGMAVDLRVSRRASCQRWLASTLLALEKQGVLDATREVRPPHFHVALFPEAYGRYLERLGAPSPVRLAAAERPQQVAAATAESVDGDPAGYERYEVNRGDSLWNIARRYNTTVAELKELNRLRNSRIAAGQVITVPPAGTTP